MTRTIEYDRSLFRELYPLWSRAWTRYRACEVLRYELPAEPALLEPHIVELEGMLTEVLREIDRRRGADAARLFRALGTSGFAAGTNPIRCSIPRPVDLPALRRSLAALNRYLREASGWKPWYKRPAIVALAILSLSASLVLMYDRLKGSWWRYDRGYSVVEWRQDWGDMQRDLSVQRGPLSVGGHECLTGIGTHAFSRIVIKPDPGSDRLTGICGVDDAAGNPGTIRCSISVDGSVKFESGVIKKGEAGRAFDVALEQEKLVTLQIDDAGDGITSDHGDWCDLLAR